MKKVILLCVIIALWLPMAAYSAPVGGAPGKGLNIGLEQDFVINRDFKPTTLVSPVAISTGGSGARRMYRTMLNVSYGFFDYLAAYVKLGGADYKFRTDIEDQFGNPTGDAKFNTKWGFVYGGGLKGAYEFKDGAVKGLVVGGDVQYLRHRQRYRSRLTELGVEETVKGKATFQEWQFGPFVGYKVMDFFPYVGVKYSDARFKIGGDLSAKYKAEDHIGTYVGLTYDVIPQLKLNLEGRFIDETALNFNVIFKFK